MSQERRNCQHGWTRGRAARQMGGRPHSPETHVTFLGQQAQGWMAWWVVGARGWMQALTAFLSQMSRSLGCLMQFGKLSPLLVTPAPCD